MEGIKTISIDKKTARFIIECLDHYKVANRQLKKENAHLVCDAAKALITYLREYSNDGRSTWMTEDFETTLDRAKHVDKKYSKLCDERDELQNWRVRSVV